METLRVSGFKKSKGICQVVGRFCKRLDGKTEQESEGSLHFLEKCPRGMSFLGINAFVAFRHISIRYNRNMDEGLGELGCGELG